jgi:hypothetical protein
MDCFGSVNRHIFKWNAVNNDINENDLIWLEIAEQVEDLMFKPVM